MGRRDLKGVTNHTPAPAPAPAPAPLQWKFSLYTAADVLFKLKRTILITVLVAASVEIRNVRLKILKLNSANLFRGGDQHRKLALWVS